MARKNYFTSTGSRVALLFVQVAVILLCAGYIAFIYYSDIHPEKVVKKTFVQTNCDVINNRLSIHGKHNDRFRADFLVSYKVKGVQYNRWVSGNGLEMKHTRDKRSQEELLSKFKAGQTYRCWYNPVLPQVSVLIPKHNWHSLWPLSIPLLVGFLAILCFLRTLFYLPGQRAGKSKARTRKKSQ